MAADTTAPNVKLVPYSENYTEQLSAFYLPKDQLEFTSLPLDKIFSPTICNDTLHILILSGDEAAGYFALETGEKLQAYSTNKQAILLTSFSIDAKHQGKGLAKTGLKLLPSFMKEAAPEVNEVVLGVNKRNQAAINLYLQTGFIDGGEIFEGPKGPQHILHLNL
ncbi:GNAT family N-acetyltransferase [Jeotgalibacillus sp. ET6]|uniref:GNAT family N-acetyltransferase n=1 Tax=Jeotgalibacillus sp. ET6 TaxID=3037260 RepID=UPI002418B465|nr:GNAT family N-acetyltransferase [Jeotgalibacillus sp. ET6]MDG5471337.1 GNAT family N-acetyltransferase [Jeotgalibacillus sp. ET6]